MEESLQNHDILPVQQQVDNETKNKKWIKISFSVLVVLVFLSGVFYAAIRFSNNKKQNNRIQPKIAQTQTEIITPGKTYIYTKRVLYFKENKLFSITPDGKNAIDLFMKGIKAKKDDEIIVSKNGEKFCFVKNYDIVCANTDGSQTKQITNNSSIEAWTVLIHFIGINDNGSKLLFAYDMPNIVGSDFEENPDIKYGRYYYDSSMGTTKFLMESFYLSDNNKESFDFRNFDEDEPIFTNPFDGFLYKLNLKNSKFQKFSEIQGPEYVVTMFVNRKRRIAIYNGYNKPNSNISLIAIFDYVNGTKIGISPEGTSAKYIGLLSVSPKFKNLIYEEQIHEGSNTLIKNYYLYSIKNKQTQALDFIVGSLLWLDDDMVLYTVANTVYKFNLISGEKSIYLENVDKLISPRISNP